MATGPITKILDMIVPEVFSNYTQQLTQEKSALIKSGAVTIDASLTTLLTGGGIIFTQPSFAPLDDDDDNVSTDDADDSYTGGSANSVPKKIQTIEEKQVRLSRNQSWGTASLASIVAGADPMEAISNSVADYWVGRLQRNVVATIKGVLADNAAAPVASEHVQNDMTNDVSGAAYAAGVTNFTEGAFVDTMLTMSDSMYDLSLMVVNPVVMARLIKLKLIDYKIDTDNVTQIPYCLGHQVIMDNKIPGAGGVYETWLLSPGSVRMGLGSPANATEPERLPGAGNGGGNDVLHNRVEWCIHPTGHAYIGTAPSGGPTAAATANNLANADSWQRAFTDRRAIKIARLITREH